MGRGKAESFEILTVIDGSSFEGWEIENPITRERIPFIANSDLAPNFGSGFHSVTPAHDVNDLTLSYIHDLSREGIICPRTGNLQVPDLEDAKPTDEIVMELIANHPAFFKTWKHQCASHETSDGEQIYLLGVDSWYLQIPQELQFDCYNELATVKFHPKLKIKA